MTTKEVANTGRWDLAHQELYADNCVSLEMEGANMPNQRVEGMEAITQKGKQWNEMVEEFHGAEIDGPIVAGNHFSATMKMDITMKGQPRKIDEEVCIFRVENGKIVSEQFFYPIG